VQAIQEIIHFNSYNAVLRDALKGVYEVYGSDLSAFFRDALQLQKDAVPGQSLLHPSDAFKKENRSTQI
jgi:hypothetical protein